ncbi:MAG: hypothetical protein GXP04_10540 [Alphaproteobacteria bacterium]|nr:hypothetical protein [Alphaproteobacteria bacterium]
MGNLKVEAIFGGVLALVVLGVALYSIANTTFGGSIGQPGGGQPTAQVSSGLAPSLTAEAGQDLICECYNDARELAGQVDVLSPEYRTGFEQCRARGGVSGGDAWTAGWNARLSGKPYEASCRAYKRRG